MDHIVFLSYRRSDTSGHAGRICDDLERYFGFPVVFRDIESINAGADFVKALEVAIARARVVIVLIGDQWLSAQSGDGVRRLDRTDDHVRREVAMALEDKNSTVLPVLVQGAAMPPEQALPESLRALGRLQAIELSEDRWEFDMARLVRVLETSGIERRSPSRLPAWFAPLAGFVFIVMVAAGIWCWQGSVAGMDRYTGLWHLPSGSFWTVREKDGQLWIEETHYESRQVWKRGPGRIGSDGLEVELELVFDREPFVYRHRLRLSDDHQTLVGSVRRSDMTGESSLALTRSRP
jgi:hypothetical protein